MRVLHILHTSMPVVAGYTIRSDYVIRHQQERGLNPAVVTSAQHPTGDTLREQMKGVTYWRTPPLRRRLPPIAREFYLMHALRKRVEVATQTWRPHVIHAASPMLVGLPALWAAKRFRLPLVYEVRDLWENASADRGKFAEDSTLYRAARAAEGLVLRHADAVVPICETLRRELEPRVGHPQRLTVVGNGVDADRFAPRRPSAHVRRRYHLQGKKVLGYIGTFQPYEGLPTLIEALPRIREAMPEAHVLITGSGGEEEDLHSLVRARGLEAHVTFTGRIPHDEVPDLYATADLLVYPRILTRTTALTTPLKPLEAMSMARTVLVSDVPAMAELVRDGETGLVFRSGDPRDLAARCVRALEDPAQRQELGANARAAVQAQRQWPTLLERYVELYSSLRQRETDSVP